LFHRLTDAKDITDPAVDLPPYIGIAEESTSKEEEQEDEESAESSISDEAAIGIDAVMSDDSEEGEEEQGPHYKMGFEGCGKAFGMRGMLFGHGMRTKQCRLVVERCVELLEQGGEETLVLTCVGVSRGAVACLMLINKLSELLSRHQQLQLCVNALLFDPVPGNLVSTYSVDFLGLSTAKRSEDVSSSLSLRRVLALYPHEPLPWYTFHAPLLPVYPTASVAKNDVKGKRSPRHRPGESSKSSRRGRRWDVGSRGGSVTCQVEEDATLGCHCEAVYPHLDQLECALSFHRLALFLQECKSPVRKGVDGLLASRRNNPNGLDLGGFRSYKNPRWLSSQGLGGAKSLEKLGRMLLGKLDNLDDELLAAGTTRDALSARNGSQIISVGLGGRSNKGRHKVLNLHHRLLIKLYGQQPAALDLEEGVSSSEDEEDGLLGCRADVKEDLDLVLRVDRIDKSKVTWCAVLTVVALLGLIFFIVVHGPRNRASGPPTIPLFGSSPKL